MAKRSHKDWQMRQRLAQEAAQILLQRGNRDFHAAKQKAAEHLGVPDTRNLPNNAEIEQALMEYQRIFHADSQSQSLGHLREVAVEAMQFLQDFRPRLVGAVLNGSADQNSPVVLHVFASSPEEVKLFLLHNRIPHEEGHKSVRFTAARSEDLPLYRFMADDVRIELIVFNERQKQPPLSPVDGRPMKRGDVVDVETLLAENNIA
ncbi:MAG: hypothetical protein PVJ63_09035 [Thioalkalispiraceae bacterium]|jgi:hypothetical protein